MKYRHISPRNADRFNPNSPHFNHQALADYNNDVRNHAIKQMTVKKIEQKERIKKNVSSSDRHQASMRALDKKLKGHYNDQYSLRDMIRGELGE